MPTSVRDLGRGVRLIEAPERASGLILTKAGAVVIDPGTLEETGATLLELVAELGQEVRFVVATRSGLRRAPGAHLFPDALLLYPTPGAPPRREGPVAGFSRDAYLRLGGVAIELLRVPGGDDGVLVRLPGRDVLFAGAVSRSVPSSEAVWQVDPERLRAKHRVRRLVPAAGEVWTGTAPAVLDAVPVLTAGGTGSLRLSE